MSRRLMIVLGALCAALLLCCQPKASPEDVAPEEKTQAHDAPVAQTTASPSSPPPPVSQNDAAHTTPSAPTPKPELPLKPLSAPANANPPNTTSTPRTADDAPAAPARDNAPGLSAEHIAKTCAESLGMFCSSLGEVTRLGDRILDASKTSQPHAAPRPAVSSKRVRARFQLSPAELKTLRRQGFVVPEKLHFDSHALAYHDIYQAELPIYVTADSILHAYFISTDRLLDDIEQSLPKTLSNLLKALHTTLAEHAHRYPKAVARDLDLYTTVARRLLRLDYEPEVTPLYASNVAQAQALTEAVLNARGIGTVALFGRERLIDASQYLPRGRYQGDEHMERYFRSAMWLSRLEFNVVSRSCRSSQPGAAPDPAETPREAVAALALADLVERAGQRDTLGRIERAWRLLVGPREDIGVEALLVLRTRAEITDLRSPDTFERLKRAIGDDFQRTASNHPMPQGTQALPAITTLLGAGIVSDMKGLTPLVKAGHNHITGAHMAYVLGHDRAMRHIHSAAARSGHPAPPLDILQQGREALADDVATGDDLYRIWMRGVLSLAEPPQGQLPAFYTTQAHADLRLNSALVGYGQLRNNYVLMAGMLYDEYGCTMPDGYVEPALGLYDALIAYAARVVEVTKALPDPWYTLRATSRHFERMGYITRILRTIAAQQLMGAPLSRDAMAFLNQIMEGGPRDDGFGAMDSHLPPEFSGWYLMLFPDWGSQQSGSEAAFKRAAFVSDFYTSTDLGTVAYVGARGVRMGIFDVGQGASRRLVVGPVAAGFEHEGPLDQRRTDKDLFLERFETSEPWASSYTVANGDKPAFECFVDEEYREDRVTLAFKAPEALGRVTIRVLDHHRNVTHSATRVVGAGDTRVALGRPVGSKTKHEHDCVQLFVHRTGYWTERCAAPDDIGSVYGLAWRKPKLPMWMLSDEEQREAMEDL